MSTLFCGTLEYKAPEALLCTAPYNPMLSDCYSLGVLLYVLATHQFPYVSAEAEARNARTTMASLHRAIVEKRWTPEGVIAQDGALYSLLAQLLNPITRERITAAQVLVHPWIADTN